MADLPEEIASLLIPMMTRPMLVPNVAVAEIAPWESPMPVDEGPEWLLGNYAWRGIEIPLVSLELMNDPETEEAQTGKRVAVMNGLGGAKTDFYAICVQGIPRLVRVYPQDIGKAEEPEEQPSFQMLVLVNGERATIPNLDYVEQQLSRS